MRKITSYIAIILLVLTSCESLEDVYKERDEQQTGYAGEVELELLTEDYEAIAEIIYGTANNASDSAIGAFIEAYEHFNDTIKAAEYIPPFLADIYPAFEYKSSALVTYNYNGEMPEDFEMYTESNFYELEDADYASFDSILNIIKYYTPTYKPEVYIPGVLNEVVSAPDDGDIILVGYKYADADPAIDLKQMGDVAFYSEGFTEEANGLGSFTAFSTKGNPEWEWAKYGNGCAAMNGYDSDAGSATENDDWLVSPAYDLSNFESAKLAFNQTVNYNDGEWDMLKVKISTDYDGSSNPTEQGEWTELSIPNIPFEEGWTPAESGDIDLSAYIGETVYIAFQYTSTASHAGVWQLNEVSIKVPGVPVTGKAPENYKNYYLYTEGTGWSKAKDIYYVNDVDYAAMGDPGDYNNFSASAKPADYLPALLASRFPLAGEGVEVVTVYTYYNTAGEGSSSTLADKYTYKEGEWTSSYNFVEPKVDQFLVTNENKWVFDPTVTFKMNSDDFQMVVEWVKANKGEDYIDSYGTQEFFTGAGSYYANYDIRDDKFDTEEFDSWEQAVVYSTGKILLPLKFPTPQTQVDGIDMFYIVNFDTYNGSDGNYSIRFQVTKAGPDPEFTYIEGPY